MEKNIIKLQSLVRGFIQRRKKVIEPCNFENLIFIDCKKLRCIIKNDYLTPSRIEYYNSTSTTNYNLEDGFIEYITTKAVGGKKVSDGNSPIDIINEEYKIGLDITCLCCNSQQTNEKSIMQNFSVSGNNLDTLFATEQLHEATYLYKKDYHRKMVQALKKYNLNNIYYLVYISIGSTIYLSLFKLNICAIVNIRNSGLTLQKKSIIFLNFIDSRYGETKLYKSKKRLELRFNKKIIKTSNTIQIY